MKFDRLIVERDINFYKDIYSTYCLKSRFCI